MRTDPLGYLANEIASLKEQGIYRTLRQLSGEQGAHATFDGRSVVNLSSNNYLGLTTHPKLRAAALKLMNSQIVRQQCAEGHRSLAAKYGPSWRPLLQDDRDPFVASTRRIDPDNILVTMKRLPERLGNQGLARRRRLVHG